VSGLRGQELPGYAEAVENLQASSPAAKDHVPKEA